MLISSRNSNLKILTTMFTLRFMGSALHSSGYAVQSHLTNMVILKQIYSKIWYINEADAIENYVKIKFVCLI